MNLDPKKVLIAVCALLAIVGIGALLLSFFMRQSSGTQTGNPSFGSPGTIVGTVPGNLSGSSTSLPVFSSEVTAANLPPIFNISSGPVIAATLIDTGLSTTTVARYVMGDSGHVIDMALDVPGAAPRIVSDTTIPGVERALWTQKGTGVLLQYLEGNTIKTVHLSLAAASISATSSPTAASVHFLPDDIADIAVSPDGGQIAYLMQGNGGLNGYISKPDGSNSKKIFSIPLSQVVLSWPASGTLLVQSKAASGVPGIALSVQARTGAVVPILWGQGLTISANTTFFYALYRTDSGQGASLFVQNIRSGGAVLESVPQPLDAPLPEQCIWSAASSTRAYCAAPAGALENGYLDLFHQGVASIADVLISIDAKTGQTTPIATPGTTQGGEVSDMIGLALSPDERYLSFVAKDDQTLWGIRLK